MRKFFAKLVLCGGFLCIFILVLELLLFCETNEYSYKYKYLCQHEDDIECLILGASVSSNGINPKLISMKSFNAATEGRPLYYDYALVKEFVPKMKKLKCVVTTLTPSQLYRNYKYVVESSLSGNHSDQAYRSMHLKYMGLHFDWKDIFYYPETYNSYYNFMGRFTNSDEINRNCDSLGYQMMKETHINSEWKNTKVINYIDYTDRDVIPAVNENISYLVNMASICKDNNVRLIILWPPFHKAGISMVNDIDLQHFNDCARKLNKMEGVEVYDFSQDPRFENDEYYYNPTHLNAVGTDKFTMILNKLLSK